MSPHSPVSCCCQLAAMERQYNTHSEKVSLVCVCVCVCGHPLNFPTLVTKIHLIIVSWMLTHPFRLPSREQRIQYYLGNRSCPRVRPASIPEWQKAFNWNCSDTNTNTFVTNWKQYPVDMKRLCALVHPTKMLKVTLGDLGKNWQADSQTFAMVRRISTGCGILVPIDLHRHWKFHNAAILRSTPWQNKVSKLVWRGTTTGGGLRRLFVRHLSAEHNVRFVRVAQGKSAWIEKPWFLGRVLSVHDMMTYRYLLMLPGNDVPSGLNWALASNSVVLMPPPRKETWLMEGLLRPWVHYAPVSSPHDVASVLKELERDRGHLAKKIVSQANQWMDTLTAEFWSPLARVLQEVNKT